MISIIVAVAQNQAIGKDNDLLWHLSADLKHFKKMTSGNTVIMGKRTFYSLPIRPLPNRRNIVISDIVGEKIEGCEMAYSIDEAMKMCSKDEKCFIIGGGSIYRQFLPLVDKLEITWVYKDFEADTFFPAIDETIWRIEAQSEKMHDEATGLDFAFFTYVRR
ncbi:MAG TPA: dihydrofolate reductase [Paludibacteraceae bacterium]|nr:dihydrofolate reductase [Paludibacteraceae bacterium]HPD28160.1 dihydrofolate reductase [Paludibacteraceae bacterium]HPW95765.1 dihydrofolate reductase [Paludibacteraceae bacterium]HQC04183.1 dihydrofolate reductase [Paludibacteraceae bacterium]